MYIYIWYVRAYIIRRTSYLGHRCCECDSVVGVLKSSKKKRKKIQKNKCVEYATRLIDIQTSFGRDLRSGLNVDKNKRLLSRTTRVCFSETKRRFRAKRTRRTVPCGLVSVSWAKPFSKDVRPRARVKSHRCYYDRPCPYAQRKHPENGLNPPERRF